MTVCLHSLLLIAWAPSATGTEIATLGAATVAVPVETTRLSFSENGETVVASGGGQTSAWRVEPLLWPTEGRPRVMDREDVGPCETQGHSYAFCAGASNEQLVVAVEADQAELWLPAISLRVGVIEHDQPIEDAVFSPDAGLLAILSEGQLTLYDPYRREPWRGGIYDQAVSAAGNAIAAAHGHPAVITVFPIGGDAGTTIRYPAADSDRQPATGHDQGIALSPSGARVALFDRHLRLFVWDSSSGELLLETTVAVVESDLPRLGAFRGNAQPVLFLDEDTVLVAATHRESRASTRLQIIRIGEETPLRTFDIPAYVEQVVPYLGGLLVATADRFWRWEPERGPEAISILGRRTGALVSPDGTQVFWQDKVGFHTMDLRSLQTRDQPSGVFLGGALAWTDQGVVFGRKGKGWLVDPHTAAREDFPLTETVDWPKAMAVSVQSGRVATLSRQGVISVTELGYSARSSFRQAVWTAQPGAKILEVVELSDLLARYDADADQRISTLIAALDGPPTSESDRAMVLQLAQHALEVETEGADWGRSYMLGAGLLLRSKADSANDLFYAALGRALVGEDPKGGVWRPYEVLGLLVHGIEETGGHRPNDPSDAGIYAELASMPFSDPGSPAHSAAVARGLASDNPRVVAAALDAAKENTDQLVELVLARLKSTDRSTRHSVGAVIRRHPDDRYKAPLYEMIGRDSADARWLLRAFTAAAGTRIEYFDLVQDRVNAGARPEWLLALNSEVTTGCRSSSGGGNRSNADMEALLESWHSFLATHREMIESGGRIPIQEAPAIWYSRNFRCTLFTGERFP